MADNSGFDDAYRKLVHDKNYSALTEKLISNYNAKQQTQKYLQNNINALGYANSGYGASMQANTQNTYNNLYAQDLSSYRNAELQADEEALTRKENLAKEKDEQLVTYLQNAANNGASVQQLDTLMGNYGYKYDNEKGWIDANGNSASAYVKSMYDTASMNNNGTSGGYSIEQLRSIKSGDNYNASSIAESFDRETRALQNYAASGKLHEGDVIRLQHNYKGDTGSIYLKVNADGTYSVISAKDYNNPTAVKHFNKEGFWQN